jgi:hypothetical protein
VIKLQGVYVSSSIKEDIPNVSLTLSSRSNIGFDVRGGPVRGLETGQVKVEARRKDLAGEGETIPVKFLNGRPQLPPGRWEVRMIPPAGYFVSGFSGNSPNRNSRVPAEAWNEIAVSTYSGIVRFTLSSGGSAVTGVVKDGSRVAAGVPVFLEMWDPNSRQRLVELRRARTDANGGYSFRDLAPGDYRVLASFEYRSPDSAAMEIARATSLRIEANHDAQRDLDLYVIP